MAVGINWGRVAKYGVISAGIGTGGYFLVRGVVHLQRTQIFQGYLAPDQATQPPPGAEVFWREDPRDNACVEAWFLPALVGEGPRPTVFFAHAANELIDKYTTLLDWYRERGLNVVLIEYRGYGSSVGEPSEAALAIDYDAFYDHFLGRPDVDPSRIVFHGRSLGTAVLCGLSSRRAASKMVLEGAFTSISDMVWHLGKLKLPQFMFADKFDNRACIQDFCGPILFLSGSHDAITPPGHAEELAQVARAGHLVRLECGHNDGERPWNEIAQFLGEDYIIEAREETDEQWQSPPDP